MKALSAVVCVAMLGSSLVASASVAQELPGVRPGDRIRVTLLEGRPERQSVLFTKSTAESLSAEQADRVQSWSWSEIRGVERYAGHRGHTGTGAKIGAVLGLLAGASLGIALASTEPGPFTFHTDTAGAIGITLVGTAAGAAVGALLGTAVRTERWNRVEF